MTAEAPVLIVRVLRDALRREGWPKPARKHPADRGGLTRGGITSKTWGLYRRLGRLATPAELNAITESEALDFYYTLYVLDRRLDRVTDPALQALLIDWTFTSWDDPIRALQRSLDVDADGVIGRRTLAALSAANVRAVYRDVFNARVAFYLALSFDAPVRAFLKAHPASQLHNCRGWINRCLEFTP